MGKFCTQCGRPLADGEVCNCKRNMHSNQLNGGMGAVPPNQMNNRMGAMPPNQMNNRMGVVPPNQPNGGMGAVPPNQMNGGMGNVYQNQPYNGMWNGQYQNPVNPDVQKAKNVLARVWMAIKKPAYGLEMLAYDRNNLAYGFGMIGSFIVVIALIVVLAMAVISGRIKDVLSLYDMNPPYAEAIMLVFLLFASSNVATAGVFYGVDHGIYHGNTKFGAFVVMIGVKDILTGVILLLVFLTGIISTGLGAIFMLASVFVPYSYMAYGYMILSKIDKNKKAWALWIVSAIMIVVNCALLWLMANSLGNAMADVLDIFDYLK